MNKVQYFFLFHNKATLRFTQILEDVKIGNIDKPDRQDCANFVFENLSSGRRLKLRDDEGEYHIIDMVSVTYCSVGKEL